MSWMRGNSPQSAYAALILSAFLLSMNHVIGRGVHEQIPPVGLSFWRWFLATPILLPFIWKDFHRVRVIYRQRWKSFLLLGAMMVGGTTLIMVGLNFTTATNVAVINATQPTLTALFLWLFFGEKLRPLQNLGVAVGFAGALLIVSQGSLSVLLGLGFNAGDLVTLAAMCALAAYAIKMSGFSMDLTPAQLLFPIILCGCGLLLPFYLAESLFIRTVPLSLLSVITVMSIALLVSTGAILMWNMGNQRVGANRASIFINFIPVFGSAMAIIFLKERLEWYHLAGMLLICPGVWLVVAGATQHRR